MPTFKEFTQWCLDNVTVEKRDGQRLGQKFCNDYNITDSELFRVSPMSDAINHILRTYIDLSE